MLRGLAGEDNLRMLDDLFDLGTVTAPSGLLVLGIAAWTDYWPQGSDSLPARAKSVGHVGARLQNGDCEAIAVQASAGPLPVRAETWLPPSVGELVITVLEVGLGIPWPSSTAREPVVVGDLPVSRTGMILGDAAALDTYVGLGDDSVDGLADITYWGRHAEEARAVLGGDVIPRPGNSYGWLDVPVGEAEALEDSLAAWVTEHHQGIGLMTSVDEHTDYTRLERATWNQPLGAATIDLAGCRVLGIMWDGLDHAYRHRPERRGGCVYPVTLEPDDAGGTLLRWTIPPGKGDVSTHLRLGGQVG